MAWHECINGNYVLCLRVGEKRFRRSLNTTCKEDADDDVKQIEISLRKLERGYFSIRKGADVVSYRLSNGHVTESLTVPNQTTLKILFDRYLAALPKGSLEETNIVTMKVHRKSLEGYFGKSKLVESIDLVALQRYIEKRSKDRGLAGPLSPVTIRKEVMTLRTVTNWAKHSKLLPLDFPAKGLKYSRPRPSTIVLSTR
jgi:hypothetical protein